MNRSLESRIRIAVFDHYAPRIGPLQIGASFVLAALGFWAIILLAR